MTSAEEVRVQAFKDRRQACEATRGKPRVKVERKGPKAAETFAPDGVAHELMVADLTRAFGTADIEFMERTLHQVLNAVSGGTTNITEHQFNGVIASVAAIEPRDEIEAMLATQMTAAQDAAMVLLRQMQNADTIVQRDSAGNLAGKFMRIYTTQMEALRRHRSPGEQRVVVQHVHLTAEQAAVQVNGGGVHHRKLRIEPMHRQNTEPWPMQMSARCGAKTRSGSPCRSPAVRGKARCRMHGGAAGSGAQPGNQNALRDGYWSAAAIAERRQLCELLRMMRDDLAAL